MEPRILREWRELAAEVERMEQDLEIWDETEEYRQAVRALADLEARLEDSGDER